MTNRDDTPGLDPTKPLNVERARLIVGHNVESTAIHSRSQGWLPMLKLDIEHVPLVGPGERETIELMMRPDDWDNLVTTVRMGFDRARLDAMFGPGPAPEEP